MGALFSLGGTTGSAEPVAPRSLGARWLARSGAAFAGERR